MAWNFQPGLGNHQFLSEGRGEKSERKGEEQTREGGKKGGGGEEQERR
jgi:hypothetical protein